MAPEGSIKSTQGSKEALDVISNRISIALAKHDNLVKSWTAASARPKPREKTQEELEAEDAALFRKAPLYLGVGAPIPSHFLISDAERNNKSLRAKFFPSKGLRGSKPRDSEEKATTTKRGIMEESSDEEEGRSALGKAKKRKRTADVPLNVAEVEETRTVKGEDAPAVPSKESSHNTVEEAPSKASEDTKSPHGLNKAPSILDHQPSKSAEQRRKEKKRQKKHLKKKQKKNRSKD
jgi:hypothetical protein